MPFYEYQCKNCGHALEAMQKVSDSPLKKCPHCGKSQLQRLMSAPVFRLKGKGWYETDFKGDGDNKRNLADKPDVAAASESKDSDVKATDSKEAQNAEIKASDAAPSEVAKPKDKPVDKGEKAPAAGSAQKVRSGKNLARGRIKGLGKKAAAKAKKRR
jgi:putative FmdB family regulatory protein